VDCCAGAARPCAAAMAQAAGRSRTMEALPPPRMVCPLTTMLNIRYPVLLAGMANISMPKLAAAVCNAGGLGVVGGAFITPATLRAHLRELKSLLTDPTAPFGVDLLLPKVGGGARATNKDYTRGTLGELVDVMIEEGATIFVCAVGVPPVPVVERLHGAGILVMNMVGSPRHVSRALAVGVDAVCAQGSEAGGHTGDVRTVPSACCCP
jgi:NAD(P)H-dependent flavin oxidoreductase YrpB (nitropropane dioxygenase family)